MPDREGVLQGAVRVRRGRGAAVAAARYYINKEPHADKKFGAGLFVF